MSKVLLHFSLQFNQYQGWQLVPKQVPTNLKGKAKAGGWCCGYKPFPLLGWSQSEATLEEQDLDWSKCVVIMETEPVGCKYIWQRLAWVQYFLIFKCFTITFIVFVPFSNAIKKYSHQNKYSLSSTLLLYFKHAQRWSRLFADLIWYYLENTSLPKLCRDSSTGDLELCCLGFVGHSYCEESTCSSTET